MVGYTQSASIKATATAISDSSIVISGEGFPTSGYSVKGAYNGTNSTSYEITDATSLSLVFSEGGIPFGTDEAPTFYFISESDQSELYPVVEDEDALKISNSMSITASTSAVSCAFTGGCSFSVTGSGLFAALQQEGNSIQVCEQTCDLDY